MSNVAGQLREIPTRPLGWCRHRGAALRWWLRRRDAPARRSRVNSAACDAAVSGDSVAARHEPFIALVREIVGIAAPGHGGAAVCDGVEVNPTGRSAQSTLKLALGGQAGRRAQGAHRQRTGWAGPGPVESGVGCDRQALKLLVGRRAEVHPPASRVMQEGRANQAWRTLCPAPQPLLERDPRRQTSAAPPGRSPTARCVRLARASPLQRRKSFARRREPAGRPTPSACGKNPMSGLLPLERSGAAVVEAASRCPTRLSSRVVPATTPELPHPVETVRGGARKFNM